jgi:hypothetical protein
MATGRCLCGAVSYEVSGPLRDVLICHCVECRRWNGHASASTAARRADLRLRDDSGVLRWIDSPDSDAHARRGFCSVCGSSLFWERPDRETVSISAGTLDGETRLRIAGHEYTSQAGEYYDVPRDGTPHHPRSA